LTIITPRDINHHFHQLGCPSTWHAIACATAAVLLSSCGTLNNNTGAELFPLASRNPNDAVVIFSAGAANSCMTKATTLTVFRKGSAYGSSAGAATMMMSVDFGGVRSDYEGHQGSLHVVSLPAGDYYLTPVLVTMSPVRVRKADFSVQPGEVVYLGEYFMTVNCSRSTQSFATSSTEI
jgi:hypothetical protein